MKTLIVLAFFLWLFIPANAPAGSPYILLNNGKKMPCDAIWEDGNTVYCTRHGQSIGYARDRVEKTVFPGAVDKPPQTNPDEEAYKKYFDEDKRACLTEAAYKKAEEIGYHPLILCLTEDDKTEISGTVHLNASGNPQVLDGDAVFNVGFFPIKVADATLHQGECMIRKNGEFIKLPGKISCFDDPAPSDGLNVLLPERHLVDGLISIEKGRQSDKTEKVSLPAFRWPLFGEKNPVRIKNPNHFSVKVGLRSGDSGRDFSVPALGAKIVRVPDGQYDIYFMYSDRAEALFQGDSFSLHNNGIEIQIVQIVDGNYNIRQVR